MEIEFTGSETPAEIATAAFEWCASQPNLPSVKFFYENSIPKVKYEFQGGNADIVCVYRVDKMLQSFYSTAENIFNENLRVGLVVETQRPMLLPSIAFSGMTTILSQLLVLLSEVFLGALEGAHVLTAGIVLHSLVKQSPNPQGMAKTANKEVQQWIDDFIARLMKEKREYLAGYLNTHQLFHIPTGVGRPPGSKKSEEQKQRDAAKYLAKVEAEVRRYHATHGKRPTKTAIAHSIQSGGINPKTGTDSRLSVFSTKLRRMGLDFEVLVDRVVQELSNKSD